MPKIFTLQPERRNPSGGGYVPCPDHAASRWVLLSPAGTRITTFTRHVAAKDALNRANRLAASTTPRLGGAGTRYGKLGQRGTGKIIASSTLSPHQNKDS